jgi:hypothetical protein
MFVCLFILHVYLFVCSLYVLLICICFVEFYIVSLFVFVFLDFFVR